MLLRMACLWTLKWKWDMNLGSPDSQHSVLATILYKLPFLMQTCIGFALQVILCTSPCQILVSLGSVQRNKVKTNKPKNKHGSTTKVLFGPAQLSCASPGLLQTCRKAHLWWLRSWGGWYMDVRWPPAPLPGPVNAQVRLPKEPSRRSWEGQRKGRLGWEEDWVDWSRAGGGPFSATSAGFYSGF